VIAIESDSYFIQHRLFCDPILQDMKKYYCEPKK